MENSNTVQHPLPGGGQQPKPHREDWPLLEDSLRSIINQPSSISESEMEAKCSKTKFRNIKQILKMPKDQLRKALLKECDEENVFIRTLEHSRYRPKEVPLYKPSNIATQFLALNDLKPLRSRSTKFPRAQYFCHLCEYHCDTIEICINHIKDTRHSMLAKKQELDTTLFHLPRPNKKHLDALDNLLAKLVNEVGLSKEDLVKREQVANRVNELMKLHIPGSTVRHYGSSLSGFGLKDSDLNLDLQIPTEIPPHEALIKALHTLVLKSEEFSNVSPDFTAKIPTVTFFVQLEAGKNRLRCELSLNNHMAYQTSALLRDYGLLDPRVTTLAIAMRFWAHMCKLDRQAEGTLPSHAFPILLIHYLQQLRKPVLPIIHDYLDSNEVETYTSPKNWLQSWKTLNTAGLAELWIEFFEYYSLGIHSTENVVSIRSAVSSSIRTDKHWNRKKMAIEDPFSTKRSLSRSVSSPQVLDFISNCFRIAYLYFGTIQTTLGPILTKIIVPPREHINNKSKANNNKDSTKKEDEEEEIRENKDLSPTSEADQNTAQAQIQGVAHILNQLKIENTVTSPPPATLTVPAAAITLEELEKSLITKNDENPKSAVTSGGTGNAMDDLDFEDEEDLPRSGETFETYAQRIGTELTPKQAQRITELVPKNMILFKFDGDILRAGQSPILVCSVCSNEGHLQKDCPEEQLPPLKPLPKLDPNYVKLIGKVLFDVQNSRVPSKRELADREGIVKDLTAFVKKFYPTATLTLFGSSVNGFSFARSDLDLSLTFEDHPTDENLNCIDIIEKLAEELKKKQGMINVQSITSAKVPIIKFTHKPTRIEGDISLYNILAMENTRMLRTYASIDPRVKTLGYVVKEFAKRCDIGDASRGSLSSYAYILMLIYYLQQVQPPVVPVLQEIHDGTNADKPVKTVDGWNAWFYSDLERLRTVWSGLDRNKMSVAELWMGFLNFYAGDFDDARLVVCTRMSRQLSKFEKMWNSPCIAIEDPFDLNHNLGAGISRKMNIYIKTAFILTRELYGIPGPEMPLRAQGFQFKVLTSYFFDPNRMTDGAPPNDRGCRACGKIGHLVRDCPKKKASEEHKKQMKNNRKKQDEKQAQNTNTPTPALTRRPTLSPPTSEDIVIETSNDGKKATTDDTKSISRENIVEKKLEPPGLPPPAPPLTATSAPAPVDNNLIALLQSGGLLNFPPNPYQMQQTGAQPAPKTEQFLPGLVIPPGLSSSSSDHNRSFPALPNTAISVEDLERNLVSEPKLPQPAKQQPPQQQPQQLIPPPGFTNLTESHPHPSLDPLKALEFHMMQNQSLFRGQVEPLLGRPTGAPNPIWSNQSNTTTQPPPPHPQLGFALGPAQPPAFNSFGLGPHGLFAPSLPTTAATVAQGPPAHAFGLGHAQSGGQSLMNSMQQEKPLQLNQLPGFNLFNGPQGLFGTMQNSSNPPYDNQDIKRPDQ